MLNEKSLSRILIMYSLSGFYEDLTHSLTRLLEHETTELLYELGFELIEWRIEPDALLLVLFLVGDKDKAEKLEENLRRKLNEKLSKLGLFVDKILLSTLEYPPYILIDIIETRFYAHILLEYCILIEFLLRQKINIKDLLILVGHATENGVALLDTFKKARLIIPEKEGQIKLTRRGLSLLENADEFIRFINKWSRLLRKLDSKDFVVMYVLSKINHFVPRDFAIEKILQVFDISLDDLQAKIDFLITRDLITATSNNLISLSKQGKQLMNDFLKLIDLIEKCSLRKLSGILSSLFDRLETPSRYLIHRNGMVEKFSFGKLLEFLILAGLRYDMVSKVLDGVYEYIRDKEFVSGKELIHVVKTVLNILDPTGETSSKFDFFTNTGDYITVSYNGTYRPLSLNLVQKIVNERLSLRTSIMACKLPPFLMNEIIIGILNGIRMIFSLCMEDITRENPIIIEYETMLTLIENILSQLIPLYKDIKRAKNENDILNLLQSRLEMIDNSLNMMISKKDANLTYLRKTLINTAKKLLWIILILFGYWPHPSITYSATFLIQNIRHSMTSKMTNISFSEELLEMIKKFAYKINQFIMKSNARFVPDIYADQENELSEIILLAHNLCKRLLEELEKSKIKQKIRR